MTSQNDLIKQYLAKKSCQQTGTCGTDGNFMNFDAHPNLKTEQFQEAFFNRFIDQSQFLRDINTFRVSACSGKIPMLDSCSIVTGGKCATSCPDSGLELEETYLTYELKDYVSVLKRGYEFMDCNKLGTPEFVDRFLIDQMMATHANNMAIAAIMGNEDLPTGPTQSRLNNLLGVNDGFLKLFCECTPEDQVIDAQGAGLSQALYMAARKKLQPQFRSMRDQFVFMGGVSQTDWLAEITSYRPTDKGDQACETGRVGRLWGNSFYELPEWPENLPYGDDGAGNPTQEVTHLAFTTLDNLYYVQRTEPRMNTEYDIDCDSWKSVLRSQADFMVADERKVVLIKNIDVCGEPWDGCVVAAKNSCNFSFENPACPAE